MKDPFDVDYANIAGLPLYSLNLDDPNGEQAILDYLNANYKNFQSNPIHSARRMEQTENLAAYLGFSPNAPDTVLSADGPIYNTRQTFKKLRTNPIRYLTDNLVSRFTANKPNFEVSTVNRSILLDKCKALTAKKNLKSFFQMPPVKEKFKQYIRQAVIFAESYMEVFWDTDKGPSVGSSKVGLVDESGADVLDESGNPVMVTRRKRLGDGNIRLWDPRMTITQPADFFEESEWVILCSFEPVEKVRLAHPEFADQIKAMRGLESIDTSSLICEELVNHTLVYKMYHRAVVDMPDGRLILATPDVILKNIPYPHPSVMERDYFPVIQVTTVKVIGSERGQKAIVSQGKGLQIAKNNLLSAAVRNVVSFPPFRAWEDRAVDGDKLRQGIPQDVTYKNGMQAPKIIKAQTLMNEELELMKQIDQDLQRIFTVSALEVGGSMPNVRSREQMDFISNASKEQTFPIEDDIRDALIKMGQVYLAILSDEYKQKDQKKRMIRYYGPGNRLIQEEFDVEDLQTTFDLRLDASQAPDTFEGRVKQIQTIQSMFPPNSISTSYMLDTLEIGAADAVLGAFTRAEDLAREDINDIFRGKKPRSLQRWIDIIPYYEEFIKVLQLPEVQSIIDEKGYSGYLEKSDNPEKSLKGDDLIAYRLLNQINTAESILCTAIYDQKAKGLLDPQTQQPPLQLQVLSKFPCFPMIYVEDAVPAIDPMAEQEQSQEIIDAGETPISSPMMPQNQPPPAPEQNLINPQTPI